MTDQLPHQGPTKGDCEGNQDRCTRDDCPLFGTLLTNGRIRGCGDPVARGRRNKRKGQRAQRQVANKLGIPTGWGGGNEETWQSNLRLEVKAGKQVAPVINAYRRQKAQSDANKSIGDNRPFAAVCVHDGLELLAFDLRYVKDVLTAIEEQLGP